MRYDMKYKKLNVEDNESCNLQCEKKCEKLAGVFICCILAFFLLFLSTRNVGLIYCYADELSEDSENTAEDAEQEQQKIKETILSEFEYGEIVICNVKRNVKNWQVFLFAVFWLFFCCFYRREM